MGADIDGECCPQRVDQRCPHGQRFSHGDSAAALASLRQGLSQPPQADEPAPDPHWVAQITRGLNQTELAIRAVLETDGYTLGDISRLKAGDILKLQATLRSPVKVESNDQPLFLAAIGESDGFHTLRIEEEIDAGRQFLSDVLSG